MSWYGGRPLLEASPEVQSSQSWGEKKPSNLKMKGGAQPRLYVANRKNEEIQRWKGQGPFEPYRHQPRPNKLKTGTPARTKRDNWSRLRGFARS